MPTQLHNAAQEWFSRCREDWLLNGTITRAERNTIITTAESRTYHLAFGCSDSTYLIHIHSLPLYQRPFCWVRQSAQPFHPECRVWLAWCGV